MRATQHTMTEDEWANLPVTFGTEVAARVFGCTIRYVQTHPKELGAVKVAGHWIFSKPKTAEMLGIQSA